MATRAPDPLRDTAMDIIAALHRSTDPMVCADELGDVLERIIGEPEVDKVLGKPVAIWDKLRDVLTRLERLENPATTFHVEGPPAATYAWQEWRGPETAIDPRLGHLGTKDDDGLTEAQRAATEAVIDHARRTIFDEPAQPWDACEWDPNRGQPPIVVHPRPATDRHDLLDRIRLSAGVESADFAKGPTAPRDGHGNAILVGANIALSVGGVMRQGKVDAIRGNLLDVHYDIDEGRYWITRDPSQVIVRP